MVLAVAVLVPTPFEFSHERAAAKATAQRPTEIDPPHGNVIVLQPKDHFVPRLDTELGPQLLGYHHLPFWADPMSHTMQYN